MICPFCDKEALFVPNEQVYRGKRYGESYMMYVCFPCDARVGVHHNDPARPLGTMATKELRDWRRKAHGHIDLLWRSGEMKRKHVYAALARLLGLKAIHIGESDIETCRRILDIPQKDIMESK